MQTQEVEQFRFSMNSILVKFLLMKIVLFIILRRIAKKSQ